MGDIVAFPSALGPTPDPDAPNPSAVMIRLNGHDYPLKSVGNCRVCQSPHRAFIEKQMLHTTSWTAIAASLEGLPSGHKDHPNAASVRHHFKQGHLPIPLEVRRSLIDKRQEEIGADMEAGVAEIVDEVLVARLVVRRTWERIIDGEIEPTVGDALKAGEFLHKVEQESGERTDVSAYQQSIEVFFDTVLPFVPENDREKVTKALARNPILKAIAARTQGREPEEEGIVDAEIVEDGTE